MMAQFGRDDVARRTARRSRSGSGCSAGSPPTRWSTRTAACRRRSFGERPARAGLVGGRRDARRARRVVDPLRRAVADAALLRPVRGARHPRARRCSCSRSSASSSLLALARRPDRRPRRDRRRAAADRRRLPHRPLPDLPADRRPADPDRDLRPVPAGAGTCSGRRSTSRPARGCRRASSGRSSWRRSSAGTCSARGAGTSWPRLDAPPGHRRRRAAPAPDPARGRDGRR